MWKDLSYLALSYFSIVPLISSLEIPAQLTCENPRFLPHVSSPPASQPRCWDTGCCRASGPQGMPR